MTALIRLPIVVNQSLLEMFSLDKLWTLYYPLSHTHTHKQTLTLRLDPDKHPNCRCFDQCIIHLAEASLEYSANSAVTLSHDVWPSG